MQKGQAESLPLCGGVGWRPTRWPANVYRFGRVWTWNSWMKLLLGLVQLTRMSLPSIAAVKLVGGTGAMIQIAWAGPTQAVLPAENTDRTWYSYRVSPSAFRWVNVVLAPSTVAVSVSLEPERRRAGPRRCRWCWLGERSTRC